MSNDYEDGQDNEDEWPRDDKVDEVKPIILSEVFGTNKRLLYSVQVETQLERRYFHWITNKALAELAAEGRLIRSEQFIAPTMQRVFFYTIPAHRFWKREAKELSALLARIYDPRFTQALGDQAELMFDSALARIGFAPIAKNTNNWRGRQWTASKQNLDRIAEADGLAYGIEIKNTQNYIPRDELRAKVAMCRFLDLIPLFILRFAPKSYIHEVQQAGGFCLLFEEQLYPFGYRELLDTVRRDLGLKVQISKDIPAGHMQRLRSWHDRRVAGIRR